MGLAGVATRGGAGSDATLIGLEIGGEYWCEIDEDPVVVAAQDAVEEEEERAAE